MGHAASDPSSGRREAVVIVNPAARVLPKPERLQELRRWLEERGWRAEWLETTRPREATGLAARAAERGTPLVLVCGGDGTLNEAANGLAGSETALAMIPGGTVNIWAQETGIPRKALEAVRLLEEGERRRVDLGKAGQRYFLLMAGYGLDGAIARRVSHALKGRVGAAAYGVAALRMALRYRGSRVRLRLDGEEWETDLLMLVVGNTRNYAGVSEVTPRAKVDDGLLDVCVYQGRGTPAIVLHVARTALGRHLRSKRVLYRQVRRLEMEWEAPLPLQMDGDAYEESPTEVTVAPGALWVVVPRGVRGPLFSA